MKFYDAIQLDPSCLKKMIHTSDDPKQRRKLWIAMATRAVLLVAFAVVMISPVSKVFGEENSAMGVALFCIMMGIRFVDFGYCIQDSLINLALAFALLLLAPSAAALVNPALAAVIHVSAFFIILFMTSDRPEMGNAGLYTFAYIYLSGNPVAGAALRNRALVTLVGYVLCAAIMIAKHRKKNVGVRFWSMLKNFSLSNPQTRWHFQLAMGVGILLGLSNLSIIPLKRMMWAAFACGSVLGCFEATRDDIKERFLYRLIGTLIGSAAFVVAYWIIPAQFHMVLGMLGGLILGFCTDYRAKTACNCLGALFIGSGLYGVPQSVMLRIANNFVGVVFGALFWIAYQKVADACEASAAPRGAQDA